MVLHYNRDLYTKTALLKASYHFTDSFYIHLDMDDANYLVNTTAKTGPESPEIEGLFSNELLAQVTREKVVEQTKHTRELLLGRAFSSTIIEDNSREENPQAPISVLPPPPTAQDESKLFEDWFLNHES